MCDIYRKTKVLTDELKSDFLTILGLDIPSQTAVIMTSELYKIDWWGILDPLTMMGTREAGFYLVSLVVYLLASIARGNQSLKFYKPYSAASIGLANPAAVT